ncbi:MAG TPA: hypothetical protein VIL48_00505 [Acidimicrobiales bacterium]
MHAPTRGRITAVTAARPGHPGRRTRRFRLLAGLVALGLLGAACSGSSEASPSDPDPTFRRAEGQNLRFPEPVATVSQLVPPTEDEPWTVVGSVFDPEARVSHAATWQSDDGVAWERQDVEPEDGDVSESFSAVADSPHGRFAVGWVGDGAASDAAVWRRDGDSWTRIEAPELGGEHEQWAFDVVASDTGILVAGGESVWGEVRPRLWFSEDGENWEVVDGGPGGPFDATGQESLRDITPFDDGFVAVGSRNLDSEQDGIAWFSPDGREWSQVDAPTLGGDGSRQSVQTVTVSNGVVVAGGYTSDLAGQGTPVVWRSRDGREWGRPSAPLPLHDDTRSAAADMSVRTLAVDEAGMVAAGGSDWRPTLWRSVDNGQTWTLLPNPVASGLFQDGVALAGAAMHGDTTLALGLEPTVMRLDGDRWQDATGEEFPKGGEQPFATGVALRDDDAVVAGGRYRAPSGDERERYVGQVWNEGDDGWRALDTDHLNAGQIMDITPFEGGYIAVGFEDFGIAKRRTAGENSSPDGLVWVSPDGREWSRVGASIASIDEDLIPILAENSEDQNLPGVIAQTAADQPFETDPPAGGPGTQSLDAVAPLGDGFIAVGVAYDENEAEPIVVTGSSDDQTLRGENPQFTGPGTQRFRDVCVSPDGVAIAVGITGTDGAYDVGVRRRNAEGQWGASRSDDRSFGGPGNQQAYGCAASEEGFVVVGSDDRSGDSDARIWFSEDGVTFTRVESGLLGGAGDQWAGAVAAVPEDEGGGWLVGGTDTVTGDGDVALWRLHPGGEVSRRDRGEPELGGPGEQTVNDMAIRDGRVVLVGDDYGRAGVWESDTIDR